MSLYWNCETQGCYKHKCVIDWGFLRGAFPRGIEPTDIDGFIEIGNKFLIFEWKDTTNSAKLTTGQKLAFERLTRISSVLTVIICYGKTESRILERIEVIKNGVISPSQPSTTTHLYKACEKWAQKAESNVIELDDDKLQEELEKEMRELDMC